MIKTLKEELTLLKNEIKIINELNQKIQMGMDFDNVIDDIIYSIRDKIDFDDCNISLIYEENGEKYLKTRNLKLSPKIKDVELAKEFFDRKWNIDENTAGTIVARTNKEMIFPDYDKIELTENQRENVNKIGLRSFFCLPLSLEDKVFGIMGVANFDKPMNLSEIEKEIIRNRALLIARAIENYNVYNRTKKQKEWIEKLNEITNEINVNLEFKKVFDKIFNFIKTEFGFEGCNLSLVTPDKKHLKFEIFKSPFKKEYINNILPLNEKGGRMAKCILNNEHFYQTDIDPNKINNPINSEAVRQQKIKTILHIPLSIHGEVIGAMYFSSHTKALHLSSEDIDSILLFTNQISTAIKNAKLYEQIENQKSQLELYKDNIEKDLFLANRIQRNFIPKAMPDIHDICIASEYIPMFAVGGDYFDFFVDNSKKGLGVLITDASGHGIQAALITSMVKMAFESEKARKCAGNPAELLNVINDALINKTADNFITAMYAYFDLIKRKVKLVCAGHNPMYLIDKDGGLKKYHPKGRILTLMEDIDFDIVEIEINEKSRFFFYTDGLTEAVDNKGKEFEDTLINILKSSRALSADKLNEKIIFELKKHAGNKKHFDDDVAIITLDFTG